MTPDPLTIKSIELQGINKAVPTSVRYNCGCIYLTQPISWQLCPYHQGYDDGVEAARRELSAAARAVMTPQGDTDD